MFKIYNKYLIINFLKKFLKISCIFFTLIILLGVLEEISFTKDLKINFLYPYVLTLLNAPITLFEIFPFIFLLSTQFFFYELFKKDELNLLKKNGLSNFKIIKILFLLSLVMGIFNVLIFYNLASNLKFYYSEIKNDFSNDNKYLAMITNNGLWIKDEINKKKLIIKSNYIKDGFLSEAIINEFDQEFNLTKTIQSNKIDIKKKDWIIFNPIITTNNISNTNEKQIVLTTNFNEEKINTLYSNVSTLNFFKLFKLNKDFSLMGYSNDEIMMQILKLISTPLFCSILTIVSAIIMFSFTKEKSLIFFIIIGILISVLIYYMNFLFLSLGNSGGLSIEIAVFSPIIFFSILSIIGLLNINEK